MTTWMVKQMYELYKDQLDLFLHRQTIILKKSILTPVVQIQPQVSYLSGTIEMYR